MASHLADAARDALIRLAEADLETAERRAAEAVHEVALARGHLESLKAELRALSVDDCPGCGGGRTVRYCSIHGLQGSAPR